MRSLACDQVEKIYGTGCIPGRMSLLMMLLLVEQLYVSFTEIQSLYLQYKSISSSHLLYFYGNGSITNCLILNGRR